MENQSQATLPLRSGTGFYRATARIVGILFLAGMVVGIGGNSIILSLSGLPDPLTAIFENSQLLAAGAMLILMAGVWDAAHGILMFPVLKQHSERIAIGYLGYRLVDAGFVGLWSLFILLQIPLAREYVNAGASDTSYLQALSAVSTQASLYAYDIAMIFVGLAGVLLCYTLFKTRLVPRLVAVWGIAGYVIHFGGALLTLLGFNVGMIAVLPGGLWELFIGVWLVVKGFSPMPGATERGAPATGPILTSPGAGGAMA